MPKVSKESMVIGGLTPIPNDRYTVVIKQAECKTAAGVDKDGNPKKPTLRVKLEIIAPPSVVYNGETYAAAGRILFMMPNSIDPSVDYGLGRIQVGLEKSKFDFTKMNEEGELELPEKCMALVGHKMDIYLDSHEEFAMRPFTQEEKDNGAQGTETYRLDQVTGERISRGWRIDASWDDVCGPATGDGGMPY